MCRTLFFLLFNLTCVVMFKLSTFLYILLICGLFLNTFKWMNRHQIEKTIFNLETNVHRLFSCKYTSKIWMAPNQVRQRLNNLNRGFGTNDHLSVYYALIFNKERLTPFINKGYSFDFDSLELGIIIWKQNDKSRFVEYDEHFFDNIQTYYGSDFSGELCKCWYQIICDTYWKPIIDIVSKELDKYQDTKETQIYTYSNYMNNKYIPWICYSSQFKEALLQLVNNIDPICEYGITGINTLNNPQIVKQKIKMSIDNFKMIIN
jgi:hypothetical protein